VQDFAERFNAMLCHARNLDNLQKAKLFVGGHPDHIRVDVAMRAPQDLPTAMYLAWAFELRANAMLAMMPAAPPRPARPVQQRPQQPVPVLLVGGAGQPAAAVPPAPHPFRRLTPTEQQEHRRQGLCYNCDESFVYGHQCKCVFYLEARDFIDDTDTPTEQETEDSTAMEEVTTDAMANTLVVSLYTLADIRIAKSMVVPVLIKGERFLALLDTGSTHNFLRGDTMQRLGLATSGGEQLRVTVANGGRLPCAGIARNVPIVIGGAAFSVTCAGINLGGFDFILSVDFLRTLGPILWDLEAMTVSFLHRGTHVQWQGVHPAAPQPQAAVVSATDQQPMLDILLEQQGTIFSKPTGLPPARPYDHRIHLLPGTEPVVVRPYRYPQLQKDELERQCTAMLAQGIIRPSTSPFSAPVLLVRKADKSWRFCIDYCTLNTKTSKDKFPIPVVDELLDELHGACFFYKLDLRSGYHQVRMYAGDIDKTAFRTHHGHYEFLVMPFGLSNAPATFQALMNDVLRPYLRKFVLIFFDDILIYSTSWAEHLRHLSIVLNALRAHSLHLKRSECSFGTTAVAYLGHVISEGGVAMDAEKVATVAAWPQPRSAWGLRGFLGLASYYRKFIRDFGLIAAPLTRLLRRDAFAWDDDTEAAFEALKGTLTSGPVLQMQTSPSRSWWTAMRQGSASTRYSIRPAAPQPTSASPSPPATSSWRPTSGSSSA
jgi:hypothetical protein